MVQMLAKAVDRSRPIRQLAQVQDNFVMATEFGIFYTGTGLTCKKTLPLRASSIETTCVREQWQHKALCLITLRFRTSTC